MTTRHWASGAIAAALAASILLPTAVAAAEPPHPPAVIDGAVTAPAPEPDAGDAAIDPAPEPVTDPADVEPEAEPAVDPDATDRTPDDTVASADPEGIVATAPESIALEPVAVEPVAILTGPASAPIAPPVVALSPGTRDLRFTVLGPDGQPLSGAVVTPHDVVTGPESNWPATTNANGEAAIGDLPYGNYRFHIEPPVGRFDLLDEWWLDAPFASASRVEVVTLSSQQSFTAQLDSRPNPGAYAIAGTVVNAQGQPIRGATIELYANGDQDPTHLVGTDELGAFEVRGLDGGTYLVALSGATGYGATWHGGATRADAAPIVLNGINPDETVSFELEQIETILRVLLTDPYGNPINASSVALFEEDGPMLHDAEASDGWVVFSGLDLADRFQLRAAPRGDSFLAAEWWDDAATQATSTTVVPIEEGELVIEMQLDFAATITGDDEYAVEAGTTLTIDDALDGVLLNDSGQPALSAVLESAPVFASDFAFNTDGTFSYTPAAGYVGVDVFTYRAVGSNGDASGLARVVIEVWDDTAVPPVAVDDTYSTPFEQLLVVDAPGVLANDVPGGQPIDAVHELVEDVAHGTLVLNPDGSFAYEPDAGFVGVDRFRYTNEDGDLRSEPAVVTITVDAPVATDDPAAERPVPSSSGASLAGTGSTGPGAAAILAAIVAAIGLAAAWAARRRRPTPRR